MALPVGSRADWDDGDDPGGDEEWEICNDKGFVYKRCRRRRPSDDDDGHLRSPPPSSSRAREAETRRARKKKSLLSLRDKYRVELDQWQQLSTSLAQISATAAAVAGPTEAPSDDAPSQAPAPSSSTEIDELLLQVEAQEAILAKMSELCDYVDAVCDAEEEMTGKALTNLPVWGSPKCLVAALTSSL